MPGYSFTKVADGNIAPMRFVTLSTTVAERVTQSTSGEQPYGISGMGTRYAAYKTLDDGYAAVQGEELLVYGPPEKDVALELGGTVAAGDYLKPDTAGKGVVTTTDHDKVGARAMAAGVAGQIIRVQVLILELSR